MFVDLNQLASKNKNLHNDFAVIDLQLKNLPLQSEFLRLVKSWRNDQPIYAAAFAHGLLSPPK